MYFNRNGHTSESLSTHIVPDEANIKALVKDLQQLQETYGVNAPLSVASDLQLPDWEEGIFTLEDAVQHLCACDLNRQMSQRLPRSRSYFSHS